MNFTDAEVMTMKATTPTLGTYRSVAYKTLPLPNHCKKAINEDPLTSPA